MSEPYLDGQRAVHPLTASTDPAESNGRAPSSAGDSTPTSPDELRWERSYDRQSVDAFMGEVEAERTRLQAEIDAAKARTAEARAKLANRQRRAQSDLASLVLAAQEEIAAMEEEHRETVSQIRAAAVQEAARLLSAARSEAAAARQVSASLASLANVRGHGDPSADQVSTSPDWHPGETGR